MFKVPTLDYFGSCGAHFFDGLFTITWLQFYRTHRVFDCPYVKAVFDSVEDSVFHAVIGCQSPDYNFFHVLALELFGEIGFVKSGVTVFVAQAF